MKTLLEEAMFEGLVQSYRNSTDPNLLALIDSINQGDRTALAPLSDYYRANGEEDKADMFLWCWKRGRWPRKDEFGRMDDYEPGTMLWIFTAGEGIKKDVSYKLGSGILFWKIDYVYMETKSETIFGCFENFYTRMWSKCPEHTAKLMEELQ